MPEPAKFPQRNRYQRQSNGNGGGDGKSWQQWKQELFEAIEELDAACAKARQVIYSLRPLVRPRVERSE